MGIIPPAPPPVGSAVSAIVKPRRPDVTAFIPHPVQAYNGVMPSGCYGPAEGVPA